MKFNIRALVLLFALVAVVGANRSSAQVFTSLYSFTNGSDGADSQAGLLLSGSTLFGTASGGGTNISGTAFTIGAGGAGFATLHTFSLSSTNTGAGTYTNSNDGTDPQSVFVLSGGTLYGTAYAGGTNGCGTVFALNTERSGFNALHVFGVITNYFTNSVNGNNTNTDGSYPSPGLVLAGNTLYGTTEYGGTNGSGTIFAVNTDGSGFTTLYNFSLTVTNPLTDIYTNGDGANPAAGLVLCGSMLYGTAQHGGTNGSGTVFAINTDGAGFTTLYNFSATGSNFVTLGTYTNNIYTNNDGAWPAGGLIAAGNMLYGTAEYGGTNGCGTIFALNTNGTDFVTLHHFGLENYSAAIGKLTNSDGVNPQATLALAGGTLFGTAYAGGTNDCGTVFSINTNGTDFATIHNFTQLTYNTSIGANTNTDGAYPYASMASYSSNMLYGVTAGGGAAGAGTVFAIVYPGPIPLNYQLSGQTLTITWDNSALTLESAPTITGPWTTVPGAASPYIVAPTNSGQFYQLFSTP